MFAVCSLESVSTITIDRWASECWDLFLDVRGRRSSRSSEAPRSALPSNVSKTPTSVGNKDRSGRIHREADKDARAYHLQHHLQQAMYSNSASPVVTCSRVRTNTPRWTQTWQSASPRLQQTRNTQHSNTCFIAFWYQEIRSSSTLHVINWEGKSTACWNFQRRLSNIPSPRIGGLRRACAKLARACARTVWLTMVFAQAHQINHERIRTLAPTLRRACAELARAGFFDKLHYTWFSLI